MNIASLADALLETAGDFDAFVFGDRTYGSAWCHDAVCRLAQAFASSGIAPGDRVVLLLPNSIEHVLARWAVLRAGAVVVCVAPTAAAAEVERIVDHSGASALVAGSDLVVKVRPAMASVRLRFVAGEADGWIGLDSLIASHPPMAEAVVRVAEDAAQISYTSGVSSVPKGVLLTHGTFEGRAALAQLQQSQAGSGASATVRLAVLPFSYSWGSSTLFAAMRSKTTLVCLSTFDPGAVLFAVEWHHVERIALVPPMCEALAAFTEARKFDLSSLRAIEVGGAPVTDDLLARCESALGLRPVVLYGMTEHGLLTGPSPARKPGACGRLRPGIEARIVDPEGRDLGLGQVGELLLASPGTAAGYYRDPEASARTFRDGWLHTGDLARLDHDRDLFVVGRIKELIIQGGVNVYPSDVVQVLSQLDGVSECAVIGIPNAFLGEEVTACVVLAADANISEEELLAHCRQNMDLRKAPTNVRFLPELPRTSAGKVRLADLRTQIVSERDAIVQTALVRELEVLEPHRRQATMRAQILACVRTLLPETAGQSVDEAASNGQTFGEMGLTSMGAVLLANALARQLGRPVSPTITFSHVTVDALARHLVEELFDGPQALSTAPKRRHSPGGAPIAVVGIGCRLPGDADGPARFWELLRNGLDATTDVPRTRFDVDAFFDPVRGALGKTYVRRGAFIDADQFDAEFFGLGPREAEALAPEHRLLLEITWEALEHAGYQPLALAESMTSVFLGMTASHYGEGRAPSNDLSAAVAAGRVSHFFNFRGPSVAIDTACSSSLVALHQAVQSLRRSESDLAIVAGVKVMSSATWFINACQKQIASPDARTRTFDADASGTSLGEGCVAVVLKRLEDVEASRDRVLAIVRGSAINSDGRSTSLAAPNGKAQEAVIRAALHDAGVLARNVDYLEAHGTGTILGDPIELHAAAAAYCAERDVQRPLIVGSVKTNIGHLEAAAGLAGFVKAVLALQHREIPASLNFQRLNPALSSLAKQFVVPTQSRPWPESVRSRRLAAVTSMGISGTNSHVVLEEAPDPRPVPDPPTVPALLTLSARSTGALEQQVSRYARHIAEHSELRLVDLCATAALGRAHFDERLAVVATSRDELSAALTVLARGDVPIDCARGRARARAQQRLAFLFPGTGLQYAGMGRQLYEHEPVFRAALERCALALEPLLDRPLLAVLYSDDAASLLNDTTYAQPATFAVTVSLAELWRSWGIVPEAVVGQSLGEITAACVAGALSLEDAAKIVCRRTALLGRLRGRGGMAVVGLPEAQTLERLAGKTHQLSVAITNGSASTVVSGDVDALHALVGELESQGVFCRRVNVEYAAHSHHVDEIREELLVALADIEPRAATVPLYSTVTGERLSGRELGAEYWARNVREPVRFASVMTKMVAEGFGRFVEMSSHPSLGMAMAEWVGSIPGGGWFPSLERARDDGVKMRASLGELYVRGAEVDWNRLYADTGWQRAELPTYPFERRRYWRMALVSSQSEELATGSETDLVEAEPAKQALRERLLVASPEERNGLLNAQLRTLLSGLLGDVAASIPVDDSLLAHGLDSLRIMTFLAGVQRAIDCVCLPADFMCRPTLRDFGAYLGQRLFGAAPAIEPVSAPARTKIAAPQLVVLRAEGSRAPVFCPHPAGGEATAYLRLRTLLGQEHPLYAIQSRACGNPDAEHESLALMARDYADIVQRTRPGPYVFLGWSMGGMLSHAIAAELEQRGQHVGLVAMIDPPQPAGLQLDDIAAAVRAAVLEVRPECAANDALLQPVRGLTALPHARDLLRLCEQHGLLEPGSIAAEVFEAMVRLRLRHIQLVRAHRPGVIRADMTIWWAGEPSLPSAWSSHTLGRLSERSLGGSHYTIVLPPRIEVIANELRSATQPGVESSAPALPSQSSLG